LLIFLFRSFAIRRQDTRPAEEKPPGDGWGDEAEIGVTMADPSA